MVQIGVYGLGGISRRVIQGVLFSRNANLYAVCSSSIEKLFFKTFSLGAIS